MKKLMLAVGAVLSVGAAFAASYNVSDVVGFDGCEHLFSDERIAAE